MNFKLRALAVVLAFDAGRGAAQRLDQLGISFARIDAVFLTHLHSWTGRGVRTLGQCFL